MKKLIYLIVLIVALSLIIAGCGIPVVPPTEQDEPSSLTKGGTTWTVGPDVGDDYTTIQAAIDAATTLDGDTIKVAAGIYNEDVTVNKAVAVIGAGQANTEIQGSVTITAPDGTDRVVLQDLTVISPWETSPYVGNTFYAIYIDAKDGDMAPVTIQNVTGRTTPTAQRVYGAGVLIGANGNTVDDVVIDSCTFNKNSTHGMFIQNLSDDGGFVTNVTLSNSTFDDNNEKGSGQGGWGLYILNPCQVGPFVNHFTVTDCSFNDHLDKGIYVESLSNATFTNVTANNNYMEGFDINLKYAAYENLVFNDCTFIGNGTTDNRAGLIIKGRNDSPSYDASPASLTGVDINSGTFSGNGMGISVGNNVTDIEIHDANISGNYHTGWNINAGVINWTDSAIIDATCNWWGDFSGPSGAGTGLGDAVSENVVFDPWIGGGEAPVIGTIIINPLVVAQGTPTGLTADFTGPTGSTYTANIDWGDGSDIPGIVSVSNGGGTVTGSHTYDNAGVFTVTLSLTIEGNCGDFSDTAEYQYAVVYDPSAGFVTGGGWIDSPPGAYIPDNSLTGTANFGFVSKYKKGQSEPIGNTEFQFKAGDLNFHSDTYEWLVIAGHKAKYKGTGTINGTGDYGFMLSAIDEKLTPSTDVDMFRIKIWDKGDGDAVVYDNNIGEDENADPTTGIAGGQIVIHKAK